MLMPVASSPTLDERKLAAPRLASAARKATRLTFRAVSLVDRREAARADFLGIGLGGFTDTPGEVIVSFHEARRALEQSQHVFGDQDLSVALSRGTDANYGRTDAARDVVGDLLHHALEDDAESAGAIDRLCVGNNLVRFG